MFTSTISNNDSLINNNKINNNFINNNNINNINMKCHILFFYKNLKQLFIIFNILY